MKSIKKKIFFISGSILLLLFLANRIFFFKKGFLENFASNITYPVIVATHYITNPIKNMLQKKASYNELKKQSIDLLKKNEDLLQENIKLQNTLRQVDLSQDLVDFQKRYNLQDATFAKVLVKNFSEDEHYFLINKGTRDGVEINMAVFYKFQLIGKITDVFRYHSKILLISDKNCKVSTYANSTSATGICVGKNKVNHCKMRYVSHLSKIQENDLVFSSGQGLVFPEGFCLGKIAKFRIKKLYYKIEIEPLVDLKTLKFCMLTNQEKLNAF